MAFCANCGKELPKGVKFCSNCGAPVNPATSKIQPKREQVYAGKIVKCPNCGEPLEAFVTVCPLCGYEIRETESSSAIQEFSMRLSKAPTDKEKIAIIRNFPIPNTKEDILEFSILAATNINENLNLDDEVSDAWFAKLGQAYQKAQVSFKDQPEFDRVKDLYVDVQDQREKQKKRLTTSQLMSALPNIVIVTVWLLSLFVLIPLSREHLFSDSDTLTVQLIFMIDMIFGIFIVPPLCRNTSSIPKMIAAIGTILTIIVIIPLAINDDIGFIMMILVDIICSAIILVRLFRHGSSIAIDSYSIKISAVCIGICLIVHVVVGVVVAVMVR